MSASAKSGHSECSLFVHATLRTAPLALTRWSNALPDRTLVNDRSTLVYAIYDQGPYIWNCSIADIFNAGTTLKRSTSSIWRPCGLLSGWIAARLMLMDRRRLLLELMVKYIDAVEITRRLHVSVSTLEDWIKDVRAMPDALHDSLMTIIDELIET